MPVIFDREKYPGHFFLQLLSPKENMSAFEPAGRGRLRGLPFIELLIQFQEFAAFAHAKLLENIVGMRLGRPEGYLQLVADFLIAIIIQQQSQDFLLPGSELVFHGKE